MKNLHPKNMSNIPEMAEQRQSGWNIFTPEVSWFIHDFFRYDLKPYHKLIFYSYYINGMTLEQISDRVGCSIERVSQIIKAINKKINYRWKHKEHWRKPDDSQSGN
jgi:hypothetical protein